MNNIKLINDFEVEDLGVQELDVYDIEVENCHNFFANDILVHNSGYLSFTNVFDAQGINLTESDGVTITKQAYDKVAEYGEYLNSHIKQWAQDVLYSTKNSLVEFTSKYSRLFSAMKFLITVMLSIIFCL